MKTNSVPWEVLNELIYEKFKIFEIRRSTRINPRTNVPFDFFLMRGLDWVNIIALTPDNEVVLVNQYRHGAEQRTIEIPGGCVDESESDPKESALRELLEETGYAADQVEHLGTLMANPAMQSMRCSVYLARNAKKISQPSLDPGEDIEVLLEPLPNVLEMVRAGKVSHALVVAAFGLYALKYAR